MDRSVINAGNDAGSFFGIEGGHTARVHDLLYTAITEFMAPPLWVPSKISLWKATMRSKSGLRIGVECAPCSRAAAKLTATLFGPRLAAAPRLLLTTPPITGWQVSYVGFKSCNDSSFVNRQGRIFRAVSDVTGPGKHAIEGPYTDASVALEPGTRSQPWEGTQGADSMQPLESTLAQAEAGHRSTVPRV